MPRKSETDNVRKICGCATWKTCTHPWYLDFQQRGVRHRENLDLLIGRHAIDFTEAKDEARRAIVARLDGYDPRLAQAIRLMEAHVDQPLTIEALAKRAGVTARTRESIFRTSIGETPGA